MSGSQKVLKVFSIFEVLIAAYYVYLGIAGETITSFVSAALYLVAAVLLFVAAKDATKAGGIAIVLNLIAFIAANNVKRQGKQQAGK